MDNETTSQEVVDETTSTEVEPSEETIHEEPSAPEDTYTEEEETSDEEPSLLAGKYKTPEELEKGYIHNNIESARMAKELAELKREVELQKMTPEQRDKAQQTAEFVKQNDLMTKSEYQQMLKDQQESQGLQAKGASQKQIDKVMELAQYGKYSKMTITDIYKDIYGGIPKQKPRQGVTSKPSQKIPTKNKPFTRAQIKAMSLSDLKKNHAEILARGVE
jgi:hypothetical protein